MDPVLTIVSEKNGMYWKTYIILFLALEFSVISAISSGSSLKKPLRNNHFENNEIIGIAYQSVSKQEEKAVASQEG